MSSSLSAPRRRERWQDIALGAFLVGSAALLVGLFLMLGGWRLGHGMHVTAVFADATGLVADAPVVVAGVPVGRVEKLSVKGGKAIVLLDVARDADLRADVGAVIRARSLLGEKVVDLVGGTADAPLDSGATITRTSTTVEADQILTRLAPVLEKVDPDDLARLVGAAAGALSDANLARVYRFADRLDALLAAGGPKALNLLETAEAIAPKAERLLTGLEASLPAMDRLVGRVDELVGRADALAVRANGLATRTDKLVAALDTQVAGSGGRALARADLLLGRLPASLDRLDRLSDRLTATLDATQPTLDRLGNFVSDANIRRILLEEGVRIRVSP
ncbi:MAG: MCE family protein [Candidatus Sericytochromatia bacterium]|nr:MCE family protein [Candidatus Tanganyikabacteria bacterium]